MDRHRQAYGFHGTRETPNIKYNIQANITIVIVRASELTLLQGVLHG
jgi:hypothetical protein